MAAADRSRLSAVNSQLHTAATTIKSQREELDRIDWSTVEEQQFQALRHAAVRTAVHARGLLDEFRVIEQKRQAQG